jgi:hypothetical protein|tara:strand:- start:6734 stop:6964 length:231 start_codon:yes stop_codon:yes gene_type:complete
VKRKITKERIDVNQKELKEIFGILNNAKRYERVVKKFNKAVDKKILGGTGEKFIGVEDNKIMFKKGVLPKILKKDK